VRAGAHFLVQGRHEHLPGSLAGQVLELIPHDLLGFLAGV